MNTTIFMMRRKADNKVVYAIKMNGRNELFVIDTVHKSDDACMLEYDETSQEEFENLYEIVIYKKGFNLLDHMNRAFKRF